MHLPYTLLSLAMMRKLAKYHPLKTMIALLVILFLILFGLFHPSSIRLGNTKLAEVTPWLGMVVVPAWSTQLGLITYYHFGNGRREVYGNK